MKEREFSKLEIDILKLVALGYENKDIAKRLYVSSHSVKAYIAVVLKKLGAVNRTHATYIAVKRRLIPKNLERNVKEI